MKIQVDTKQRIKTSVTFMMEFYKVLMGTMLGVFVPYPCGNHICSITENIFTDNVFHFYTNVCNYITCLFVLFFYIIELNRENWCITYLDVNKNLSAYNLDSEIEKYPTIKTKMNKLNKYYLTISSISLIILIINFIVSSINISFNFIGMNAVTSIVSFFMLVMGKLSTALDTGKKSVRKELALSSYMTEQKVYNTIDVDYRITKNIRNNIL